MLSGLFLIQNFWIKSLLCLASSYLIGFFTTKQYISYVKKNNRFFQPIRESGPQEHLKTKKNTPTMGGIFIVLSTLFSTFFFSDVLNPYILITCFVFITFSLIGLTDDLMKILYKNTKGFRGSIKIIIQFTIIGMAFLWLGYVDNYHFNTRIFLPFGEETWINLAMPIYIVFVTFMIVGTSNAVNLTDGLDGLVSVPTIVNLLCLIGLICVASEPKLAHEFLAPQIADSKELIFFCIALIGAIAAFLRFNLKPAKIFMGDVGSLAIGSVLGLIAIIIKQEFIFLIISLLFVAEAVSVILQVGSYKLRKKRIFLMAPLHHHFEKLGWPEAKVVKTFWFSSLLFAVVGLIIFLA
jgi:phospho-N-acetylmuramoyl-pentapeptide-transferase